MLFLIIAIVVGWGIERIWPTLVLAAIGYGVVITPINMLLVQHNRAEFGESLDWSVPNVALSMTIAALMFLGVGLIAFCIKRLVRRPT